MSPLKLPCGCQVERKRPQYLAQMCPACLAEFTALHNRASAEHNLRAIAGEDPRSRDRTAAEIRL